ncbi:Ger(x)C family spore germination protein [Bacillus sp. DTU_2020_1000418_1_SI_GHA_SEK_038]|uniref:Ger(x)C family spore germination protein n=1 Tax=Bacillus sp. DTU_2020_1000418_1_SI_GHA_SEK_038 TaxID=3077585 RepID=UPI0028EA76FC|nr:Ger(x)C family spore germination protein [Bacillus sp. DTU_2020_1000418_1_SI_GHA_SEK_038]WNS77495.1 Ger(x)C family spore germination protein [Bacillus sp. DTU_2020_1000418_1_SI_GHA_SEK_038]
MRKINSLLFLSILVLTGCWDQNLLKEVSLINSAAFDLEDTKKISTTVSIRTLQGSEGAGEQKARTETFTENDHTPRGARDKIDLEVSKKIESSKLQVLLVGEELARKEFYSTLDVFYRDPKNALNAKVALVKGKAKEVLKLGSETDLFIGEYLSDLLSSAEEATMLKNNDIQSIGTIILDPGQDITIPIIHRIDHKTAKVMGTAMFDGKKYSGMDLNKDDTVLFYLLKGHLSKLARFTEKVNDTESIKDYITFDISDVKRNLSIEAKNPSAIHVHLSLELKAKVVEYPHDVLDSQKEIHKLNSILSKKLTDQAEKVIQQLQEANCDGLGIGRRMIALHHKIWKELDWQSMYPTITFNPDVKVKIIQKGIIS